MTIKQLQKKLNRIPETGKINVARRMEIFSLISKGGTKK